MTGQPMTCNKSKKKKAESLFNYKLIIVVMNALIKTRAHVQTTNKEYIKVYQECYRLGRPCTKERKERQIIKKRRMSNLLRYDMWTVYDESSEVNKMENDGRS